MAVNSGNLYFNIEGDNKGFKKSLKDSSRDVDTFAAQVKSKMGGAGLGSLALGLIGGGGGAMALRRARDARQRNRAVSANLRGGGFGTRQEVDPYSSMIDTAGDQLFLSGQEDRAVMPAFMVPPDLNVSQDEQHEERQP